MSLDLSLLLDALNSVTAIPIIPFKGDKIDYTGHAKNVDYLMRNNYLDEGRQRVIAIAGTSLIHHISDCLLYTSPSPRDRTRSRMPSSA